MATHKNIHSIKSLLIGNRSNILVSPPNYLFQNSLVKQLVKEQILVAKDFASEAHQYYINVRLDGYSEPSLFSVTQQLRYWFYENLSLGVPFSSASKI